MTDVIVVGAGSGGSVVAARLAEDPSVRVLLLEAGPDFPEVPPVDVLSLALGSGVAELDWDYSDPGMGSAVPRGRLVGGSSAVNATYALRGQPEDYDAWAAGGLPGWGWADCLPYFRRLEDDADFGDSPEHGRGGPIHIRRDRPASAAEEAFTAACLELGHAAAPDLNSSHSIGVGPLPRNVRDGVRQSTLVTYLRAARGRPNLDIRSEALVDRLLLEGDRVVGVALAGGEELRAGRVVLAAGAYNTPQVLMRSGVGDPEQLQNAGIPTRLPLPGLGRNLLDHVLTLFVAHITPGPEPGPLRIGPTLKFAAGPSTRLDDHKITLVPGELFNLPGLMGLLLELDETGSTGTVRLAAADPAAPPLIEHRLLSERADRDRFVLGAEHAVQLFDAFAGGIEAELLLPDAATAHDPARLREHVLSMHSTGYHPAGTCRMGPATDAWSVTDERCRLHGLDGLHLADASVIPSLPRANTNLPVLMIGERVAEFVRAEL